MSDSKHDLDGDLQRALRARDPGAEFAPGVVAALAQARVQAGQRRRMLPRWLPLALAASAIAAVLMVRSDQRELEAQRGLAARTQAIEALRIASRSLDNARHLAIGD